MSKVNLKELLTGTIGLARLGHAYADAVQCRAVDGADNGIAVGSVKMFAHRANIRTGSENVEVTIERDSGMVELNSREARDVFGVLYGMISAEFDEPLDDGTTISPDFREALTILAMLQANSGECLGDHMDWMKRIDALLAKYPAPKP